MTKPDNAIRIEVFRSGTFKPMSGDAISYGADDLSGIASSYDPANAPAPIVVGHPTTDAPAFGWVTGFEYDPEADKLFADLGDIEPAFFDAVKAGRYRKVSMSFHTPDASNNPQPGNWYPKHIGFLGAAAPAVSGLKPVQFSADRPGEAVTFEASFGERGFETTSGLFRSVREWMIEKFGMEEADKVLPSYELDWLDNTEIETPAKTTLFAAPKLTTAEDVTMTPEQIAALEAREQKVVADEARFAERAAAQDKREQDAREAGNAEFSESLVTDEKLLPALKDQVTAVLNALPVDTSVSFAEGDKTVETPLADAVKALLSAQPKVVEFGEVNLGDDPGKSVTASFASDGKPVDTDQLAIDQKARAYMTQNPGVDYIAAVQAVS